jgi:ribosomal protein L16 Arg81 hydroxylase
MPRSAPETLNNGEQSLDFTYYEQTTNRFWSPHLAESRVNGGFKMSSISFDFQQLITPTELNAFFDDFWEKSPLIISRQHPAYYSALLSLSDIDYIISTMRLRHSECVLVKDSAKIDRADYSTNTGNDGIEDVVDPAQVFAFYEKGVTVILNGLHLRWYPLAAFCRSMEQYFSHTFQTNIYLTPKNSKGFKPHFDTHDVFILQVHGHKHWRIYPAPLELPLQSQPYDPSRYDLGDPLFESDLRAGDLLYLPRGYVHEGTASEDCSLHITLGAIAYTWADLFAEALSLASQANSHFRKSLPIGFARRNGSTIALDDHFRELLKIFASNINVEQALEKLTERFVSSRNPLMYGQLNELSSVENLNLDDDVGMRPTIIFRITSEADSLYLSFEGKKLQMPTYVEPALRYIGETQVFKIASLPDVLDDAGKMVLVRRLIKEGFLKTLTHV